MQVSIAVRWSDAHRCWAMERRRRARSPCSRASSRRTSSSPSSAGASWGDAHPSPPWYLRPPRASRPPSCPVASQRLEVTSQELCAPIGVPFGNHFTQKQNTLHIIIVLLSLSLDGVAFQSRFCQQRSISSHGNSAFHLMHSTLRWPIDKVKGDKSVCNLSGTNLLSQLSPVDYHGPRSPNRQPSHSRVAEGGATFLQEGNV